MFHDVQFFVLLVDNLTWRRFALFESFSDTVWVKKSPLRLSDFFLFSETVKNFKSIFTHLLYVPMYARLQMFTQLSPNFTKLCHIKRDYSVHIICSKCPPSVETHALTRLCTSLIALLIVFCGNTFIMSTNMWDMTWRQQWRHLLSKQT